MDGTVGEPIAPLSAVEDVPMTEEGMMIELRDINAVVLEKKAELKAAQLEVKEALQQGVEFGIPKWVQNLAIKVQAMDDSQRAEFWLAFDRATKAIGVGNPQLSLL